MIAIYRKGAPLDKVLSRNQLNFDAVNDTVRAVVAAVRSGGDAALARYAAAFDNTDLSGGVAVTDAEIAAAYRSVPKELLESLRRAKANILAYHEKQRIADASFESGGKSVGWAMRPVARAGLYVPGGTAAYPSSVLMTALPAVAAGVPELYMATPAKNGKINPLTLVAAAECGVKTVFKAGGAQAIAALAFGTESVPKVDVIAGPGNIYVTMAKKEVFGYVGIDMLAGPSEIVIVADGSADPKYLAGDLLSQAEHDALATAILIVTDERKAEEVAAELTRQTERLPRKDIALQSLKENGAIVVAGDLDEAVALANRIAPEHLELCFPNARDYLSKVENAGAVFLGTYAPEPLGDYFAGPNHVLPTSGTARFFSVLNTLTFMKRISVIEYDRKALETSKDDIVRLAECEGLHAHAQAVLNRFEEGWKHGEN